MIRRDWGMWERQYKTTIQWKREREEQQLENSKLSCKLCGSGGRETFLFFILDILSACGKVSMRRRNSPFCCCYCSCSHFRFRPRFRLTVWLAVDSTLEIAFLFITDIFISIDFCIHLCHACWHLSRPPHAHQLCLPWPRTLFETLLTNEAAF